MLPATGGFFLFVEVELLVEKAVAIRMVCMEPEYFSGIQLYYGCEFIEFFERAFAEGANGLSGFVALGDDDFRGEEGQFVAEVRRAIPEQAFVRLLAPRLVHTTLGGVRVGKIFSGVFNLQCFVKASQYIPGEFMGSVPVPVTGEGQDIDITLQFFSYGQRQSFCWIGIA